MEVTVNGAKCYLPEQCRDERIRATKDAGLRDLRTIASYPYAFPGGYKHYAITSDGGCLCHKCIAKEYRTIYRSTRDHAKDGWQVTAIDINYEDATLTCDHCGTKIVSEYGE